MRLFEDVGPPVSYPALIMLAVFLAVLEAVFMVDFLNRRLLDVWVRMDATERRIEALNTTLFGPIGGGDHAESFGDEPAAPGAR